MAVNIMLWKTIDEIDLEVAQRLRRIRKRQKISQEALAAKSGVSLGSIKRFEQTGEISLKSLTKLASALNCSADIEALFTQVPYDSLEEVLNESRL